MKPGMQAYLDSIGAKPLDHRLLRKLMDATRQASSEAEREILRNRRRAAEIRFRPFRRVKKTPETVA